MKSLLKILLTRFKSPIDLMLSVAVVPAAYLLLEYRRFGSGRLPKTTARLKKIGVFPIRDHYYEPMFNDIHLSQPLNEDRHLPGLELNEDYQLRITEKLTHSDELVSLRLDKINDSLTSFYIKNGSFEFGDAEFLYQIIRHLKPKKIIEIG